jgi:hypothetical protein
VLELQNDFFTQETNLTFDAPKKYAKKDVKGTISSSIVAESVMRITTIHQVKGETLDAIMLVSAPTQHGPDGHWTHWLTDPNSEAARMAYVASSRPKHFLVWAIPKRDSKKEQEEDVAKLTGRGFKYVDITA